MSDTGLFADETAVPYAPFKTVGTEYSGIIVRASKRQATAYLPKAQREAGKKGDLLWWDPPTATSPGKPKWVVIITLQTDLRDPSIDDDDGRRSLWIRGKQMETAVKKALKEAGAAKEGIVEGGWLRMKFTHETPTDGEDVSPTKQYEATYRPPAPGANTDDPWANVPTQQDPWGQTPQPAYTGTAGLPAAAQTGTPGMTPNTQQMLEEMLRQQQQGGTR
jgi:hypothetical protein